MAKLSSSNGIEKFPKLRFPEFKEPWNLVKLEDVCSYRKGRAKVKKAQYVSTENILQNYAGIEPYDDLSEAEGISIQCGDTLMANIRPYLKKVWQSNFNGACSTDVLAFSPDNIDGKFLYFLIAQDRFVNYVMCGAKGSKMPRGDKNHILEYETGVPTESEQRKIAHFIDLLNARISSQNSLINLIKKYKRGLINEILSERVKLSADKWITCRIGDFLCPKSVKQLPSEDAPLMAFTSTSGVCEKGERYDRGFLVKDVTTKMYKRTDYGDFIYSSNNIDVGSIGLNLYGSAVISDVYEIFSIRYADPWFISETIQQKKVIHNILKYRQGCLYGQYRIYAEDFMSVHIRVPTLNIQKKIGSIFSQINRRITSEQNLLYLLEKIRASLLQQLFI